MATDNPWSAYLEALNKCCDTVKLTAAHTRTCAMQTELTAIYTYLAVFYVKEALNEKGKLFNVIG